MRNGHHLGKKLFSGVFSFLLLVHPSMACFPTIPTTKVCVQCTANQLQLFSGGNLTGTFGRTAVPLTTQISATSGMDANGCVTRTITCTPDKTNVAVIALMNVGLDRTTALAVSQTTNCGTLVPFIGQSSCSVTLTCGNDTTFQFRNTVNQALTTNIQNFACADAPLTVDYVY